MSPNTEPLFIPEILMPFRPPKPVFVIDLVPQAPPFFAHTPFFARGLVLSGWCIFVVIHSSESPGSFSPPDLTGPCPFFFHFVLSLRFPLCVDATFSPFYMPPDDTPSPQAPLLYFTVRRPLEWLCVLLKSSHDPLRTWLRNPQHRHTEAPPLRA